MQHFKLRFIRKSQLAFAFLMLVTLAFVWMYTDRVNWHQHNVERINLANSALQSFQVLSSLVSRELDALSESVSAGDGQPMPGSGPSASALREAASVVRQRIEAEAAFSGTGDASVKLVQMAEIERLVEEIIRTMELIEQHLIDGRTEDARNELATLNNSGLRDSLNTLIIAAMADQVDESSSQSPEATVLTRNIVQSAPIALASLVIIAFLINFLWSRRTVHSVDSLQEAALKFSGGDLSHRIPKLNGSEFQRLGTTFNAMARRLSDQREQLSDANIKLEAIVDERTLQLQETNEKLANADRNRRKLLADISHEFRTPLTVMRGEAEIALRGSNKTMEDSRESFRRIIDQAANATRLVDDLLFIARADAGEPRFKLSSVAIASLIDSVCEEFTARARKKRVTIDQSRMAAGAVVQGDQGRLRQVFTILLDNAIKYSNFGGRIDIQVLQEKGTVEIRIRDQGIGLEEEESELAFERFYRAPAAVDKAAGTGLGLPVANAIVKAHNGTISLSGKPGQGSTAIVVLPFGREFGVVT